MSNYTKTNIGNEGRVEILEALSLTGAEVSINSLPAGAGVPFVHSHKNNEEIYGVISGKGTATIDNETIEIVAGEWLKISPAAKRPIKLWISNAVSIVISIFGSSTWQKSKYFRKVTTAILKNNTAIVFIIFLLLYIRFSLFLISSKNLIITTLFVSVLLPRMFKESEVIDYPCTLKHITCFRNQNHQNKCTSSYRDYTNYNIRLCFTIFHSSSDGIPNSIYSAATLTKTELRLNAISFG